MNIMLGGDREVKQLSSVKNMVQIFTTVYIELTKKYYYNKKKAIFVEKGVWAKWNELYIMQVKKQQNFRKFAKHDIQKIFHGDSIVPIICNRQFGGLIEDKEHQL